MIIVTGAAGFIGSSIIQALNARGERDILAVDNLKNGHKVHNLADLEIADYVDRQSFLDKLANGSWAGQRVRALFHQGACSATTEWDGQYVMRNNYEYSKLLLHWSQENNVPFLYASSASVYGLGLLGFREDRACERPINMYAYSKFLFDQYVRGKKDTLTAQVVGLRYFNVYGPREAHKASMASTAFHFNNQIKSDGVCRLFSGTDGFANGEQKRDFVYVEDCVAVNLWFFDHPDKSGIFNVGSGREQSFNDVARAVIAWHGRGRIDYIDFPAHLAGSYQSFTRADLAALREAGYSRAFKTVEEGVKDYLDKININTSDMRIIR